jgi:peptidoglycan/xylan/chitin deacetylase (PgdA/CDA1 family)
MTHRQFQPDSIEINNDAPSPTHHHPSLVWVLPALALLLTGCAKAPDQSQTHAAEQNPTSTTTKTSTPPAASATPTPTNLPTATWTPTPSQMPTDTWNIFGPGLVEIPILLYHHVEHSPDSTIYSIDIQLFESQMELLSQLGYRTITHMQLRQAIYEGALLPPKPILITFDDGHVDNYINAFPIMQTYGLTGTIYIVANRLDSDGFLSVDQLNDMINATWEVGSHSMTHADLVTLQPEELRVEILDSRLLLEDRLGVEVRSFAFPYGSFNEEIIGKIQNYGYRTGMGVGKINSHTASTIYYLSRHDVHGYLTMEDFRSLLSSNGIQ